MKKERFEQVIGLLAALQIVLYVLSFPHRLGQYHNPSAEVVGNIIGLDCLGINAWYGITLLYGAKGVAKIWLVLGYVLCAVVLSFVLFVNICALFA